MKRIKKFKKIEDIKDRINKTLKKNYTEEINADINNVKIKTEKLENLLISKNHEKINVFSFGKYDHKKIIEKIVNGLLKMNKKYLLIAEDKAITKCIFMLESIKKKMENHKFHNEIFLMENHKNGIIILIN